MRSIAGLFLLASILPSGNLSAQVANQAPNPASGSASAYPAESVVVEQFSTVYRYAADGTGSREITAVTRIQSDAAARQNGVLSIPFAASTDRVEIEYVRVRKPDGSVVETPATDAQETPEEITREAPFYSDLKEKQIPVRNLRIGDKLEYKARIVRFKAETPGDFWGQESFGTYAIILNETIELDVPKSKYVQVWSPEHKPVVSEVGDEKVYRWTGSQLKPTVLSLEDKRKASDEAAKNPPNVEGNLSDIAWTTFRTWKDVGAWYRTLEGERTVPDAAIKAKAAELTAGKTTDEEKVRAIYAYVATQIRYIGVALGIGRYQPHAAAEVLNNQYGDCKDKHTLLAALLTAAGFHPEAVLIGAGIRLNPDVPAPAAFNHLITTLPVNGEQVWLDSTAEVAPYRMLVITTRDKQALVVPDAGEAKLERTPASLPFTPFEDFRSTGKLGTDGTVKAHMEYTARGDAELVMRAIFRQVPPGQWEQLTQNISKGLNFSGTTSHVEAGSPNDTAQPYKLSYDYEKEKLGDWDNLRIISLLPAVFIPIVDDKDPPTYPIDLGEPHVNTDKSVLTLPDGWGAVLPEGVHKKTAYLTFDKTYKIEGETLTVERRLEILQRRIPISEWKAYKKLTDDLFSNGEPWIQLTQPSAKPGSGSSVARVTDGKNPAEKLVKAAYAAIQRHDLDVAEQELDLAKGVNPKEPALWSTYGFLAFQRKQWEKAIEAYDKELALYPDTAWVYREKAYAQHNLGRRQEAEETLRSRLTASGNNLPAASLLATWLVEDNEMVEAVNVLKTATARYPENKALAVRLGRMELQAGQKVEGTETLSALLKDSNDSGVLNDASYELANANVELSLAETSSRKAMELLTAESQTWTLSDDAKTQATRSTLLSEIWDTVGWVLFREGKLEEAEEYVRAALMNNWHIEVGLHMGEIQEARGDKLGALATYQMMQMILPKNSEGVVLTAKSVVTELKQRSDALTKQGLQISSGDVTEKLMKLKTLKVSKTADHASGIADYEILISEDRVTDVRPTPDAATHITGGLEKIRGISFKGWTPPDSKARIRLRGLLKCDGGSCTLERLPM